MAYQGVFRPKNPEKYRGDHKNIIYRSRWELKLMSLLDTHPDVIQWASEEFSIPYVSPVDGRKHRYFPDFFVKLRNKDGKIEKMVIEVKPAAQCAPPKPQKKITKKYLTEVNNWGVNSSKWEAAREYCRQNDMKFLIMTEKELGIKF